MELELIKNKILHYEYVSFDIFDTLVKRNVKNNQDVFSLVQIQFNNKYNEIELNDFKKQRIVAEKTALQKLNKESVSLNEIYEFIDYNQEIKDKLKEIEISTEYNIIQKNNKVYELYKFCEEKNKKIIAISDMYFDGSFLKEILKKNNIIVEKCFSSSDYGATKASGKLFEIVINELKIDSKQMIHIGDSLRSDYLQARKNKIFSIKIDDNNNEEIQKDFIYNNEYEKIIFESLNTFIKNNLDSNSNYYYNIGFSKFGCLLYGFCNWLYKNICENNIKKVYFLSRDGFIIKKAFEILYSDKNLEIKYLYISRRAIRVPTLFLNSNFENLNTSINMSNYFDLNTFIKRIGLKRNNIEKYITPEIDREFSKKEFFENKDIKSFYENIKEDVKENSRKEFDILNKYLEQEGFSGKVAIVDIGWEGTIQKNLNSFFDSQNKNIEIYGYYFGIHNYIEKSTKGYLFENKTGIEEKDVISSSFGLFETLFLANQGTVNRYEVNNNEVKPILDKYEFLDENNISIKEIEYVKEIQNGALEFLSLYKNQISINQYLDNFNIYFCFLKELLINPSCAELKKLKNIPFNDTYNVKLVETKKISQYINLKLLKEDFFKSVWKIGFLKNIIKFKLPYFYFYRKFRNIYKGKKDGKN